MMDGELSLPRSSIEPVVCVFAMMKLKVRIETEEWIYEEHEMQ
ncbi:MAG: hypothetical protein VXA63_04130 [Euryarchaeota archaeon]|jgi:hypothetical protein